MKAKAKSSPKRKRTGKRAPASASGEGAPGAPAATSGYSNARLFVGEGGVFVLTWQGADGHPHIRVGYAGKDGIKPDTWYSVSDKGELYEVDAPE